MPEINFIYNYLYIKDIYFIFHGLLKMVMGLIICAVHSISAHAPYD